MHTGKVTDRDGFPAVTPKPFNIKQATKTLVSLLNAMKDLTEKSAPIPKNISDSFIQIRMAIIKGIPTLKSPEKIFTSSRDLNDVKVIAKKTRLSQTQVIELLDFTN